MKIEKLLVAYDGSPQSQIALEDLHNVALPEDTSCLVLTVAELLQAGVAIDFNQATELAQQASEQIKSMSVDWKAQPLTSSGYPPAEILKIADAENVDLIILGSHGRSTLGRLLLGSVSRAVVLEAKCAVRIGRKVPNKPNSNLKIIIGVDGSLYATNAVYMVASRKWPSSTQIHLVTIVSSDSKDNIAAAQEIQENAKLLLKNFGLFASGVIKEGDPADQLLHYADTWLADCIFVGSRGLNFLQRKILGSVSTKLVDKAQCSIEIVHAER